jgi:cell division protein FtsW
LPTATFDPWLIATALALLCLGLVMVASASLDVAQSAAGRSPFYFVERQLIYATVGVLLAALLVRVPLARWQALANPLLVLCVVLLVLVFVPGIGGEVVKGARRWLDFRLFKLQASEFAKIALVVYYAAYLAKHGETITSSLKGFVSALLPLGVVAALVLIEPDLGATVVVSLTVLGMCFLAGVRLSHFALLLGFAGGSFALLVLTSEYRLARLVSFLDACEPQYYHEQGYQLCQALIAFSRGEWVGVGLGSGVQKLFYLPEAHTDFLLAVLGEELGVLGSVVVIFLFATLIYRSLLIGYQCIAEEKTFAGYLAYGIGLWLGLQAFINIAVNMGLLPTKGLTLPLMSYGGSSIVVTCAAVALLLRCDYERRSGSRPKSHRRGLWATAS